MDNVYTINEYNKIYYSIINNYVITKNIIIENSTLEQTKNTFENMINYIQNQHIDVQYLHTLSGSNNPITTKLLLEILEDNSLYYIVEYDGEIIENIHDFKTLILDFHANLALNFLENNTLSGGEICNFCKSNGFKSTKVTFCLHQNLSTIEPLPIRFYLIDDNDFLTEELIHKPRGRYIRCLLIPEFQTHMVKLNSDGSFTFTEK